MTPAQYGLASAPDLFLQHNGCLPQAGRAPALPVFFDSSLSPFPRSSVPAWTTIVRYPLSVEQAPQLNFVSAYANNALLPNQLDELVLMCALRIALLVCLEVAQIADVALVV